MEGQPFFTTVAGLSVSLAGFGAVIAWLRDDPARWDPVNLWRLKAIVRHGLTVAFLCLVLVPIHTVVNDDASTIGLGSMAVALFLASELFRVRDPDPVIWSPRSSLYVFVGLIGAMLVLALGNVVWSRRGMLEALVLALLTSPAAIFNNFVRAIGAPDRPDPGEAPAPEP